MAHERIAFRGRGLTCVCVTTTLPLVEEEMRRRGLIKREVDIYQLGYNRGGVAASAGTHDGGGSTDVAQYSDEELAVWRMFGWRTQRRTRAQGFSANHGHGWPGGCPHLSSGARWQESEWRAGRNGLVSRGRVTGPGWTKTTWQAALRVLPAALIRPTGEDELMATWKTFTRRKPQALRKPGAYELIAFNDEGDVSFASGPAKIIGGYVSLQLTGLPAGATAALRFVQDDVTPKGTKRHKAGPVTEIIGTAGTTFATLPLAANVAKLPAGTRRVRAMIAAPAGVVITRAEVSYWKA